MGSNEQGLRYIYLNPSSKRWGTDPPGCCSSRPRGWKAVLALCVVGSSRKILDLGRKQPLRRRFSSSEQNPKPLEHLPPTLPGSTAGVRPSLRLKTRVCIHITLTMETTTRNEQALGTSRAFEIELRTLLCPRSPELAVKSRLDLTAPTWNFPPDRALRLFRVFCSD